MKKNRKSQYWYLDLIVGLSIFVFMLIITFRFLAKEYLINTDSGLVSDADRFSEALLSQGIPENWTESDVVVIGIESESQKIDILKLKKFSNMSLNDYDKTRYLFGIKGDYVVFFQNINNSLINITNRTYLGREDYNESQDLFSVKRYLVYSHDNISEIVSMNLYVWK